MSLKKHDADRIVRDIDRFLGGDSIIHAYDTGRIKFEFLESVIYASAEELGITIEGFKDFDLIMKRMRRFHKKKKS